MGFIHLAGTFIKPINPRFFSPEEKTDFYAIMPQTLRITISQKSASFKYLRAGNKKVSRL